MGYSMDRIVFRRDTASGDVNVSVQFQVFDSLDRVFPDTPVGSKPPKQVSLAAARGTRASFQLAMSGLTAEPEFTLAPFAAEGRRAVRLSHRIQRVLYVPVEVNTSWDPLLEPPAKRPKEMPIDMYVDDRLDPRMAPHVVRKAPFELAEVLAPLGARPVEAVRPNVFFVAVDTKPNTPPGTYRSTLTIRTAGEAIELPIELTVGENKLPSRQRLRITNWFHLANIARFHDLEMWSPAYWAMLRKYARLMREYGQNVFWIQKEVLIEKGSDKRPRFNWPRFDRYVRLFLDEGFEVIEGCHFVDRRFEEGYQPSGNYYLAETTTPALSTEGQCFMHEMAADLWRHVRNRGWDGIYLQHVADEPHPKEAEAYLRVANLLRRAMPGVRLIEAILGTPAVVGSLDVHVPNLADMHIPGVDRDPYFDSIWNYENFRKVAATGGGELWIYSCCGPRGPALNRFLDFALIKTRLIHWLNYVGGATGYLHWGLNMYREDQDPFRQSVGKVFDGQCRLPPGDTHIIWPGDDGPWPSLRFEAMRDGIHDHELLLAMQQSEGEKAANRLARQAVRTAVDYVRDIGEFRRIQRKLIKA